MGGGGTMLPNSMYGITFTVLKYVIGMNKKKDLQQHVNIYT